jgi:hypothetical protein
VSKGLGLRSIWRWTAVEIVPAFVGVAVVAMIIWLISHHFNIRSWVELATFYVIFSSGGSFIRHLRTRRSPVRGSDNG